jgi:transposase-like protein
MAGRLPFPTTLLEMQRMFPKEEDCAAYLELVKWPGGFLCPSCHLKGEPQRFATRPRVLRCRECLKETSLTADTIMHATRTPLQVWFWAAYLVTTQTPGESAVQFQRQLGLTRYETAFQILHKLRAAMVRPDRDKIGGEWPVEVDEAWIGGKTRGEGKGVHHKTLVAGAVEVRSNEGKRRGGLHAGRLRLRVIPDRTKATLTGFVVESVEKGTYIVTDGWQGYDGLFDAGYSHEPIVLAGDPEAAEAVLPMVHLVFSNLKTWLLGTHHGVSPQHLQAYLNEFTFRFNRRFYPMTSFNSVLGIGTLVEGPTYEGLYSGEWVHPNPAEGR